MRRSRGFALGRIAGGAAAIATMGFTARAAEYFVGTDGRDTADGLSSAGAFATVGKGVSVLAPGDTLTIRPGTYAESVTTRVSGRPDAPITIRAQYPGSVVLRGDIDLSGFSPVPGMQYTYAVDLARRVEGVAERSTLLIHQHQPSVAEVEASNGSFYQDEENGRLYVHTSDSAHPENHALSVSVNRRHGFLLKGSYTDWVSDVVIDGLTWTGYQVRDYPAPGPGRNTYLGLCVEAAERITVRRCTTYLNSGGIWLSLCRDSVVEDCHSFANRSPHYPLGKNILGWAVHNVTFRRNRVEGFTRDSKTSEDDIAFYGGRALVGPFANQDGAVAMVENLAINAGIMIKGAFTADSEQRGNAAFGHGAYLFRPAGTMNVIIKDDPDFLDANYADAISRDFRLQADSRLRGSGPDGADPGPFAYGDTVFYVAPEGNDAAAGTSVGTAWRTLGHAARRAKPGHTVYVLGGTYREVLAPARAGSVNNPISFIRRGLDRVVIDGTGRSEVGIDLSGRSHIICRGFTVVRCRTAGVVVSAGADVAIEHVTVLGSGGAGITVRDATDVRIAHNLVRGSADAGIRVRNVRSVSVVGNILDSNGGAGVSWDTDSVARAWCDYNDYVQGTAALCTLDDRVFRDLESWRQAGGHGHSSLAVFPGYRDGPGGDFALRPSSPLIGRGPRAETIGPYRRTVQAIPLPVERIDIRAVAATVATLHYVTRRDQKPGPSFWEAPARRERGVMVEWGEGAAYEKKIILPAEWQTRHSVGLVGLQPGTQYHYRVTSTAAGHATTFVPFLEPVDAPEPPPATSGTFTTLAEPPPVRVFHVAVDGSDSANGLSASAPWRTVAHAARAVRPGDTVWIHAGTYQEQVVVAASGAADAPITFRAAPGETVWMSGSGRRRVIAFRIAAKHHIVIDGIRFREYNHCSHSDGCIFITGGSSHVIRRCIADGRNQGGYAGGLVRANDCRDLRLENCVMTLAMGEGLSAWECPGLIVRNCVFYNNQLRAASCFLADPSGRVTFSHNLFCDSGPGKTGVPILRLTDLANLEADHNGYFTRTGPEERMILQFSRVDGKAEGGSLTLAATRERCGQEAHSSFGNPGMAIVSELLPSGSPVGLWREQELGWDGNTFVPLTPQAFLASPTSPMARASDGRPIGLDPEAFR